MKIIDEKGRFFGRVSIVDILIILAAAVVLLSSVFKFDKAENTMSSDKTIEYTVKVTQVRTPTVDALNKDLENIKDPETKKTLGKITNMEIEKSSELMRLADGTYKMTEIPDRFDLTLSLSVPGTETTDNFYTMDGQKLITGDGISISNGNVVCYGTVREVRAAEE